MTNRKKIGTTIDEKLWKRLKLLAVQYDKDMNDLLETAIKKFLEDREEDLSQAYKSIQSYNLEE
ncbi:MAG: hypothetical protein ACOCRO_06255 [Halanaerobiales bacterium]